MAVGLCKKNNFPVFFLCLHFMSKFFLNIVYLVDTSFSCSSLIYYSVFLGAIGRAECKLLDLLWWIYSSSGLRQIFNYLKVWSISGRLALIIFNLLLTSSKLLQSFGISSSYTLILSSSSLFLFNMSLSNIDFLRPFWIVV